MSMFGRAFMAGAGAVIGAACAAGLGAGAVAWLLRRALRRELAGIRVAFRAGHDHGEAPHA